MRTKQETSLGRGGQVGRRRVGHLVELLCHVAGSLGIFGDGISLEVVFGRSF